MEAHQEKEGDVGQPGPVKPKSFTLTGNEAIGAIVVEGTTGPISLFISTKRPELLPPGSVFRFMNKWQNYCWRVDRHEPLERGRTHVVCKDPQKIYNARRQKKPAGDIMCRGV